jgi:hypothetical protein
MVRARGYLETKGLNLDLVGCPFGRGMPARTYNQGNGD